MEAEESANNGAANDAEVATVPAAASTPSASLDGSTAPSPTPFPTIEELKSQMKPCKIVLRDYFKVYDDDPVAQDDDDEGAAVEEDEEGEEEEADDGYEDSSATSKPMERRTGPIVDADDGNQMLKPPSAGIMSTHKNTLNAANTNNNSPHASIYSTSFKQFKLHCCFTPCEYKADSIRGITDHFKLDHNLSAAAMVWDKPMEPGQTEPEWQKRFEVIITHGETESLEIAKGGYKRIGENPSRKGREKGKGQFQCSRCDVIQPQSKAIVRHIEEVHCGFRRYTCALCAKQSHAIHMQLDHWNNSHAQHLSSKESLVVYSRHLTLAELSEAEFEKWRSKRPLTDGPQTFAAAQQPTTTTTTTKNKTPVQPSPGVNVVVNGGGSSTSPYDVKPEMRQLSASSSATSGIVTDEGSSSLNSLVVGAEEADPLSSSEGPPANKRLRPNLLINSSSSSKQSTPLAAPMIAAPTQTATLIPNTNTILLPPTMPATMMMPPQETATEPGEYEVLMPVKVRVSDDRIRYITFGVPRAGDKVKDQIIQLRQLDTSMFMYQNCFPMLQKMTTNTAPPQLVATAVPGLQNGNFINVAGNHVILRPPIHAENGVAGVASISNSVVNPGGVMNATSGLINATSGVINAAAQHIQAPQNLLTIPQAPPFPAGGAGMAPGSRFNLVTSVAATNGVHTAAHKAPAGASIVANQSIALSGIVNGVPIVTPSSAQQQPQNTTIISAPSRPAAAQQKQQQPQRVEVGEAGGTAVAAVATVLTRFKCNQCESVYNNRDSMVAHIYTHMKVRPFKCALCNSIAAMSKTIMKHLSKEHGSNDTNLILEQRIPNETSYYSAIQ